MKHLRHRHVRRRMSPAGHVLARAGLAAIVAATVLGNASARGQNTAPQSQGVRVAYAEAADTARSGSVHRDPQVVPAGAHVLRHKGKHKCAQGGCGPDGRCVGTCVVRPERFGYYATQWRAWPGDQGVQQTSLEEMTPVSPPASAIPSVDQEALLPGSLEPEDDDRPSGSDAFGFGESVPAPQAPRQPAAPGMPEANVPGPSTLQPEAPGQPQRPSLFDEAAPADQATPKGDVTPADETPAAPEKAPEGKAPADTDDQLDNLFDEFGSRLRLRERLAVAHHRLASARAEQQAQVGQSDREPAGDRTAPPQRLPDDGFAPRSLTEQQSPQAAVIPAGEPGPGELWRRPRTAVAGEDISDRGDAEVQPAGGTAPLPRRNPLRR